MVGKSFAIMRIKVVVTKATSEKLTASAHHHVLELGIGMRFQQYFSYFFVPLTTSWYTAVLPTDGSICRKAPRFLSSVARVTAVVVPALQFVKSLQVQQVLVRVGGAPWLTWDTGLSHVDGTIVSTTCTTVTVTCGAVGVMVKYWMNVIILDFCFTISSQYYCSAYTVFVLI